MTEALGPGGRVTLVSVPPRADVWAEGRFIYVGHGGREVRIGPLTRDQAERLGEDLGYEAVG